MTTLNRSNRSGTIVICVLVCLLIASALVTQVARSALSARREVRVHQQLRQTEWLLDAGVMRAARQLQKSADYSGEQWRPTGSMPQFGEALVQINVTRDVDVADVRLVEVIASLHVSADSVSVPAAGRTQRTHKFTIKLPTSSNEE